MIVLAPVKWHANVTTVLTLAAKNGPGFKNYFLETKTQGCQDGDSGNWVSGPILKSREHVIWLLPYSPNFMLCAT